VLAPGAAAVPTPALAPAAAERQPKVEPVYSTVTIADPSPAPAKAAPRPAGRAAPAASPVPHDPGGDD
jgi:hypothetical protein